MTYEEAEAKALSVKWKIDVCFEGEKCWCRIIKPVETIMSTNSGYDGSDYEEEYWIVRPGELNKKTAERIVSDHNMVVMWDEMLKKYNEKDDSYPLFWEKLQNKIEELPFKQ
jgi:hypothetical protein